MQQARLSSSPWKPGQREHAERLSEGRLGFGAGVHPPAAFEGEGDIEGLPVVWGAKPNLSTNQTRAKVSWVDAL